jgi:periplasmic copper chaperone A
MKSSTIGRIAFAMALAPLIVTPIQAHDIKHKALQIVHPWTHETGAHESKDKMATSADVYMTIRNSGRTADRLVSVSTSRSGQAQLVPVTLDAFKIAPGQEVKLTKERGYVRLLGLTKPLYMHDNFPITLVFEKAGKIQIDVHIEEATVAEPHKH